MVALGVAVGGRPQPWPTGGGSRTAAGSRLLSKQTQANLASLVDRAEVDERGRVDRQGRARDVVEHEPAVDPEVGRVVGDAGVMRVEDDAQVVEVVARVQRVGPGVVEHTALPEAVVDRADEAVADVEAPLVQAVPHQHARAADVDAVGQHRRVHHPQPR
jgi:hypothetical protein